jgi:hypothetical protein
MDIRVSFSSKLRNYRSAADLPCAWPGIHSSSARAVEQLAQNYCSLVRCFRKQTQRNKLLQSCTSLNNAC